MTNGHGTTTNNLRTLIISEEVYFVSNITLLLFLNNYMESCLVNVSCAWRGNCRMMCIMYKITCKICSNSLYIGVMGQMYKLRMQGHVQDYKELTLNSMGSCTLTKH